MASRSKDTIGIQSKEKVRKRLVKPLVKSSEALEDKSDSFKCKKRPWSEEEDLLVIKLVKEHGPQKWTFIATHLEGRIGKQCRERWHNHLNPNIKKCSWSEQEEWVLYLFHKGIGNKWAEIAKYIIGRTDNSIKNHWNSGMKKRLDDYGRKLTNVREIFAEVGESYFDRVLLPGEKKALEILLLNKQYVPSDCDDDEEDDEEEEEQSQEDNQNLGVNASTNQIINNNSSNNNNYPPNNIIIANSSKESALKQNTDNSQKTKEKHSVNSKAQVNPFIWTKTEDESTEKNSSTVKKNQHIPQLLKHSQSLQPTQNTAVFDKENNTSTSKSNQTQQQNTNLNSYSQILKESKNETNKQRAEKKNLRQLSPSVKEDPKKKLKLEETSPTESAADKAKKNQSQKENINPQNCKIESHDNLKEDSTRLDAKNRDNGSCQENKQHNIKECQYCSYCDESQQLNPNQQYQHSQLPNEEKPYPYQIYEGSQSGPYASYPGGYHPYPLHRSQSLSGYTPPPQSSQIQQQCYPSLYAPINTQSNVSGSHFPHQGQVYNPYSHVQAYKYDPHYYSHYQPINFMYYPPAHPNQPQNEYPQQPYPYYKDYQYPKGQQPQSEQYPKGQQIHSQNAYHNRQTAYPVQASTQSFSSNTSTKNQQPVSQNHSKKLKPNLQKSISMPSQSDPHYIQEFNSNCKNEIHLNDAKKQNKENQEEQCNRSRVDTKSTVYSQQMQSTQQSKNNQKEYMDINFIQSEQRNNYLSTLNSDFKCKQLESSPFQSKRASAMSESLQSSDKQSEEDCLESGNDQKVQRNFSNQMAFAGINGFNSQLKNLGGINYESPSKMLNLSERVMLKTLSSNKQYMYNTSSNIKYPANRTSINPLNLNSLFNQEDEFFNENSQQLN
ncbi:hypothetical protein ABPG72_003811 [Tetrahymena utriculariae]